MEAWPVPSGSMYPNRTYFGLKSTPYIGTSGPTYILFGYMDPQGVLRWRLVRFLLWLLRFV